MNARVYMNVDTMAQQSERINVELREQVKATEKPTQNMENAESSPAVISKTSGGVIGWMESMFITLSQTFVGLPFFKLIDYCLYVAEKSAQWGLPSHEISAEENGKLFGRIDLVRPLPWILFLPGLVILRIIRGGLNVGAFVLGYPRIEPIVMVKFLQKSRRRLRALNLKAVKSSRRRDKILIKSIRLTLSTLFCLDSSKLSPSPPPIKICVTGLDFETAATPDEKSTTESTGSPMPMDAKRKFSQVSSESESETVLTQLENCASDDSMEDPDFNPAECSAQSNTSSSADEEEQNISLTEVKDINNDKQEFLNSVKESPNTPLLDKTTRDTETEEAMATNEARVDSSEPEAAPSLPTQDVTNGAESQKRNEKPKSPSKKQTVQGSSNQEKKNRPRKKQFNTHSTK